MPHPESLSLDIVRTDGWFERVGQTVSSFGALCEILGERFFAFSLITGARITALTVDRRNPENTLVDFTVGSTDGSADEAERLPLADFQRRLVSALVLEGTQGPRPERSDDVDAIQQYIGPHFLLLAPLYQIKVEELRFVEDEPKVRFVRHGEEQEESLGEFRTALQDQVRAELETVAHAEHRSAIDLGNVSRAEALYEKKDYAGVKDLLGTWPAALTIFLRTPEAAALQVETRGTLAHALGLLGSSCSALGESVQAEEILRLAVQYAGDGPAAGGIYERLGGALLLEERVGEAIGPLRRAAALGSATSWPRLARAFLERGRLLAALGAVEEAIQLGVDEPQLAAIRARAEKGLGPAVGVWRDLVEGSSPH